jgi:mannosyltransferase
VSGTAAPLDEPAAAAPDRAAWHGPVVAALVGLVVFLCAVWVPALWLDEATTVVLIRRSWPELFAVGIETDPALLPYYVLVKPVLDLGGGIWTVRLVSVVAAAVCVGAVFWFARRALGPLVGLVSVALVVAFPVVTLYAQQARPQALALATVTVMVGAWWRAGPEGGGRWWWVLYALAVAATALANLLAVSVLLAPVVASLALAPGRRGAVLARTVGVAAGVLAVLSPYLYLVLTRAKGVASPKPVAGDSVWELVGHPVGGGLLGAGLLVGAALVVALLVRSAANRPVGLLLAVWGFGPSLGLVLLALAGRPTLVPRYGVVVLPALAILLAVGLVRLGAWFASRADRDVIARVVPAVGAAVLALALLPQALGYRAPDGHGEDARPTLAALAEQPTDLAVVVTRWILMPTLQAYEPEVVAERMPQVSDPSPLGDLVPTKRPPAEVEADLAAAGSVLLLARHTPTSEVPFPASYLPRGLRDRACIPTVLAVSTGWMLERLDCPPHA